MGKLAAVFIFGGFLLTFGAVGGMDNPDQAEYFVEQLVMAVVGLFWMLVGTSMLPREGEE